VENVQMIEDLDRLMTERDVDAVIAPMHEAMHASFRWLTRGAKVTKGYAVKLRGEEPFLVAYPMEREEAAATGLTVRLVQEFGYDEIFRTHPSPGEAYAELFTRIAGPSRPRLAFFGNAPLHLYAATIPALERRGITVYRGDADLVQLARKRKDAHEISAIESATRRTDAIIEGVRSILRSAQPSDGYLFDDSSQPLTLGTLKLYVTNSIAAAGMIEDHETILSQGRDAGIPHSRGDAAAHVRAGVPIVMDIFPADRTGGYFCDLTRTFCVGPVSPRLRQVYDDVRAAFDLAASRMKPGTPARDYQALVCDYFEERGYPTTRQDPGTHRGYVHSLGHGVGLDIHERPFFSLLPSNRDLIEEGDIVTIEPGLYFPDEEIGVRIEDTFVVTAEGVRSLSRAGYELEV
jgi:Xaa-Pro aminopeptidase